MDFSGKTVLVFGAGVSGISAARLLLASHAEVVLYDGKGELDRAQVLAHFDDTAHLRLQFGTLADETAADLALVVLSPGVPVDDPLVGTLRDAGIPVWSEVELAWRCGRGDVLAVTGTNGKTTTTSLLGEMMKRCYPSVQVAGNIGIPYTGVVEDTTEDTVTVVEISSFQLETTDTFHPKVAAVLNITPDHLNRHDTMEQYTAIKLSIAKNQTAEDVCVLNYEDEILRAHTDEIRAKIVYFSSQRRLGEGVWLEDGRMKYADGATEEEIVQTQQLQILGRHNHENAMAACAVALSYGAPIDRIREALLAFQGVAHRIEYVTEKRGVRFYNDSKGTNPDAAIRAVEAMDRPTCLIGGGYDKDSDYAEWIRSFDGKVKVLALIGQTREKIAAEAEACGFTDYVLADSLKEAVRICYERAERGDAVLLSPACASWGMFPNYEVRGDRFKEIVGALEE